MGSQQLLVGLTLDAGQRLVVLLHGVAADVLVVDEVGGGSNIKGGDSGIVDAQLVDATLHLTVGLNQYAALSLQSGLDALLLDTVDHGGQFIDLSADTLVL